MPCVYSSNDNLFVRPHPTDIEIGLQTQLYFGFMALYFFIESQFLNIEIYFTL